MDDAITATPAFRPLTGIYEPSAIQQLPDGRFLVVEDEKRYPFTLLTLGADGSIATVPPDLAEADERLGKLDDLEGLTLAATGHVYAITSHSRDGDGEAKKSRDKLVRFRIDGERVVEAVATRALKPALAAAHPALAAAAEVADVKADAGLNIEALEITPDQRSLLVGLRGPLLERRAIVARIDNPAAIFDAGDPPHVVALETLDLAGDGIRGMSHIPALGGYLLIGGPLARAQSQFRLWFWSGQPGDPARRVAVPGLVGLEHAEGISPALIGGRSLIAIVSDDGSRAEGRCARYLLLAPEQLKIDP